MNRKKKKLKKLTLYMQSKISKSTWPPSDFKIVERYVHTPVRFLGDEQAKQQPTNPFSPNQVGVGK
jgi:hypothetical protein